MNVDEVMQKIAEQMRHRADREFTFGGNPRANNDVRDAFVYGFDWAEGVHHTPTVCCGFSRCPQIREHMASLKTSDYTTGMSACVLAAGHTDPCLTRYFSWEPS